MSLINDLLSGTNTAAAEATNTALDQAAARPFNVVLSVDQGTQIWAAVLTVLVAVIVHKLRA